MNDATEVSQSFVPKEGADDPEESRNTDVTSPRDGVGADAGAVDMNFNCSFLGR